MDRVSRAWNRLGEHRWLRRIERAEGIWGIWERVPWFARLLVWAAVAIPLPPLAVSLGWIESNPFEFGLVTLGLLAFVWFTTETLLFRHRKVQRIIQKEFAPRPYQAPRDCDVTSQIRPRPQPPDRSTRQPLGDGRTVILGRARVFSTPSEPVEGQRLNWTTDGGAARVPVPAKPRALRFLTPHERIVKAEDLPTDVPVSDGRHITISSFADNRIHVDERDVIGVSIEVEVYYAAEVPRPANRGTLFAIEDRATSATDDLVELLNLCTLRYSHMLADKRTPQIEAAYNEAGERLALAIMRDKQPESGILRLFQKGINAVAVKWRDAPASNKIDQNRVIRELQKRRQEAETELRQLDPDASGDRL